MLKKVFKIAALCLTMLVAGTTFGQQTPQEYPQYGFWSNWAIGVNGSFHYQLDMKRYPTFNGTRSFGQGYNAGLGLVIEKELNWVWDFRLRGNYPSFAKCNTPEGQVKMDNLGMLTAGFKFNINDAIAGYNPDRVSHLYLLTDAGFGFSINNARQMGTWCVVLDAGIGYSARLCPSSSIFVEAVGYCVGDVPGLTNLGHDVSLLFNLGYMYHFGVTAADKELIAQRALLTQVGFDSLKSETDQTKNELAAANKTVKKLEAQVQNLNNENAQLRQKADSRNSDAAQNLQNVIDQLKSDQLTYYAMPFSVLFETDSWRVSESEYTKIKAISKIMKDNPSVKLTLVGFCDYTGSDNYNMKLSQKRAEEVKRIMVKKYGIDADRLDIDYKGKTIAFGDLQYSVNRRVSFYRMIQ